MIVRRMLAYDRKTSYEFANRKRLFRENCRSIIDPLDVAGKTKNVIKFQEKAVFLHG